MPLVRTLKNFLKNEYNRILLFSINLTLMYIRMMNDKWDKLPFILKSSFGERSLIILSNFEEIEGEWVDTGRFTVTEKGQILGNVIVSHVDGSISWEGKQGEFNEIELDLIVDHIAFRDFPELENLPDDCAPEPSGDYRIYNHIIIDGGITVTIMDKSNDKTLIVTITANKEDYNILINGEIKGTLVRSDDGWVTDSNIPDDLLDIVFDYVEGEGLL
jgi:hypothetical protein